MPRKSAASMDDAFLQAILEQPEDDVPRLVYADWLEEQGNPRGTFIRLQCRRAKMSPHDPEWAKTIADESALLRQFEDDWTKPIKRLATEVSFRRGFIEHVRLSAKMLLRNAERMFRRAPICSLRVERVQDLMAEIAACSWLVRVTELDLSHEHFAGKALQALVHSDHFRSIKILRMNGCALAPASAQFLADALNLSSLQSLELADNALGHEGAQALAQSAHLGSLQELNLRRNHLLAGGAIALASPRSFKLKRLSIGENRIGNDGVAEIARSAHSANLRRLDLEHNEIANRGVESLVQAPHLTNLESLDLSRNHISGRGVQLLTDSALLANLTYLNLKHNDIDRATALTIPQRLATPKMRELLF